MLPKINIKKNKKTNTMETSSFNFLLFYFSIVLDARVSIVTVAKLVDVKVTGNCKCPWTTSSKVKSKNPLIEKQYKFWPLNAFLINVFSVDFFMHRTRLSLVITLLITHFYYRQMIFVVARINDLQKRENMLFICRVSDHFCQH